MPLNLTISSVNLAQALRWTEILFALSLVIQTVEYLRMSHATATQGLWSWPIQRLDIPTPWVRRFLDICFQPFCHQMHLWIRCVSAGILIFIGGSFGLIVFLFIGNLLILIRWRGAFNGGSDFLTLVVLTGLLIAYGVGSGGDADLGARAGLWYVCIQSVTSYFMSGTVKLLRPEWRSGRAMIIFLNAAIYGPLPPRHWLSQRFWAVIGSWAFILWECAFPLALLSPMHAVGFCVIASLFHFLVFWFFGLNRFFWAWIASFPAIIWCAGQHF